MLVENKVLDFRLILPYLQKLSPEHSYIQCVYTPWLPESQE